MTDMTTSRRGFLKTAAGAALAGLPAPAIAQSGAREINMVGWNSQALPSIFGRAEKELGIKINYDVLPAKWDEVMQKITLWGQTGYSEVDVMFADDLIGGLWGMNGWADDLSGLDAWTKNSDDIVDNIKVLNQSVGGVYRIFFTMGLEPFFYNKGLVPHAPRSWSEMVATAKEQTSPDKGIWGWRPLGGEGHAFNTVLLDLAPGTAGTLAIALSSAVFTSEIFRGGLATISSGQVEAAAALGLKAPCIWLRVLLPQVLRTSLPALVNEFTLVFKATALLSAITVTDILRTAQQIYAVNYRPFETLLAAACIYVGVNLLVSRMGARIERRFQTVVRR